MSNITGREPALPRLWKDKVWEPRDEPQTFYPVAGTGMEFPALTLNTQWELWLKANGATVWTDDFYPPFDFTYSPGGYCPHTITEMVIAGFLRYEGFTIYPVFRVIHECDRPECSEEQIPF